jgi:hypothetical protein
MGGVATLVKVKVVMAVLIGELKRHQAFFIDPHNRV